MAPPQSCKVLRQSRLTKADNFLEFSHAALALQELAKDHQPRVIGETLQKSSRRACVGLHHFYIHTCSRIPSTIANVTVTAVVSVLNACLSAGFAAEQFQ